MTWVGFIGTGNMGSAMIHGIINKAQELKVAAYDSDQSKINEMADTGIYIAKSIKEICEKTKYIILAVKPQSYLEVFRVLKSNLTADHIVMIIAPGFSIAKSKKILGSSVRIVRAMPNTPALVGEGMTAYSYHDNEITANEEDVIKDLFSTFGQYVKIEESNMEAIIATSGSSPAYAYLFIEAMADAAVSFGIPRESAYRLAAQSLKGAASMVLETKEHPAVLKDAVCSPGGTTIEAVLKLEETQFRNSIIKAMTACYEKALEMNE